MKLDTPMSLGVCRISLRAFSIFAVILAFACAEATGQSSDSVRDSFMRAVSSGAARRQEGSADEHLSRAQINEISPAVVKVYAERNGVVLSSGSGALIEGTNLVLTNRHVLEGGDSYRIAVLDDPNEPPEERYRGSLALYSNEHDFALLRIDSDMNGNRVNAGDLGVGGLRPSLAEVHRGDRAFVFGYPGIGDGHLLFSEGTISSIQNGDFGEERIPVWYRTNADISPGNSGGVAVNSAGEFIGLPTVVEREGQTGRRLGGLLSVQVIVAAIDAGEVESGGWSDLRGSMVASGGGSLDFNLEPFYGDGSLQGGFQPDPHQVPIVAGGTVNVSSLGQSGCSGFAAAAPDYRLYWGGGNMPLRIFFEAGDGRDTTLLVNSPDTSWRCNDDAGQGNLNPMVVFENAPAGQYDIWVGSYNQDDYVDGLLTITELNHSPRLHTEAGPLAGDDSGWGFDMEPAFGTVSLRAGFNADPHRAQAIAGGARNVRNLLSGCTGYANRRPDYRVHWSGQSSALRFYFVANDGSDSTLLVNTPNLQWECNDDASSGTVDPMVTVGNPAEGQYDIWLGSYREGELIEGTLYMTERDIGPGQASSGGGSRQPSGGDWGFEMEPAFGSVALRSGFVPDPHRVRAIAGGARNAANLLDGCSGYANRQPDYRLQWSGQASELRIYFVADDGSDSTLLVNTPSLQWQCNDDAYGGTLDPMVVLRNPSAGQYDIWLGSYREGELIEGTLHITELDRSP